MDPEAGAAALQDHCLVEILRPGRVDGDERKAGRVFAVRRRGRRVDYRGLGFGQHIGAEVLRQLELGAQATEVATRRMRADHESHTCTLARKTPSYPLLVVGPLGCILPN